MNPKNLTLQLMNNKNDLDYIIVGGGLAGMLIAWELLERGKNFLIYCNNNPASSHVAAGTWNPVTFRKMIPTWRSQEMIDKMLAVYPKIEQKLGVNLLSFIQVEKILSNEQEEEFWKKMANTKESKNFLEPHLIDAVIKGESKKLGLVKQTGRIDLPKYVEKSQMHFHKKNHLVFDTFDHSALKISTHNIQYNSIKARNVIFAEGTYAEKNPLFNWLPFKPVKGDVLTIESRDLNLDKIRKKNIFILPIGENKYKIGATYHWSDKTWEPSEKAKLELIEKFEKISDCTYTVIDHESGIRPATHDRRPFVGSHPTHKNIHIFNGLGSKGVFLGPLLASEFCDFLENIGEIHPEVSIERCMNKYFKTPRA